MREETHNKQRIPETQQNNSLKNHIKKLKKKRISKDNNKKRNKKRDEKRQIKKHESEKNTSMIFLQENK